jgi:hypothetical protein
LLRFDFHLTIKRVHTFKPLKNIQKSTDQTAVVAAAVVGSRRRSSVVVAAAAVVGSRRRSSVVVAAAAEDLRPLE